MNDFQTYDEAQSQANQSRFAMDSKLYVTFYVRPIKNAFRSEQEGRPIFEEREYIKIIVPGDSKTTVDCPVTDEFRGRFEKQYEKFKKGLAQAVEGTPLEMWPQMTVGLCAELKAMNISTVDQLAALDDSKAQKIMGSHELRRKAQLFLSAAKGEAENNKITAELQKRDDEIALLKMQIQQILEAQKPKAKAA
jgi:hypothetical protein